MKTRAAGMNHLIVMHGCGFVPAPTGIWKGQPGRTAMTVESGAAGMPLNRTRGCIGGTTASFACGHFRIALT
jgi:hypothetical protein